MHFPKMTITIFLVLPALSESSHSSSGDRISFSLPWNQTGFCDGFDKQNVAKVALRDFQGWFRKCDMVSTWASNFRMLTLGTYSPYGEEAQTICAGMSRYSSWKSQLRSQSTGNVNCKTWYDFSPRIWATLHDVEKGIFSKPFSNWDL